MDKNIRNDFPLLQQKINNKPIIYFDSGATSQKPHSVIHEIEDFYCRYNSNVHRSLNPLAEEATLAFEDSRKVIGKAINAPSAREVIFTKNATESLNLIAQTWGRDNLKEGDVILLSMAEHHANIVPWLQLANDIGISIEYVPVCDSGGIDLDGLYELIGNPKVKLISIAHVSNTLGYINPVEKICAVASQNNVPIIIDGSQAIPHMHIDVQSIGCDFYVFTGHKVFGPTGIGVLWGKKTILESMRPFLGGGDMIHEVFMDHFTPNVIPHKFEAGTPHIAGAIGLAAAFKYIDHIGYDKIEEHERVLTKHLLLSLKELPFIATYGFNSSENHIPLASFTVESVHAHDVADLVGRAGICIRAGHHCAQPLHDYLGVSATARASLAFYNTVEEIDALCNALKEVYTGFTQ